MHPNLTEERKLWKKGYKRVACIDEVGRGALCGPVVAAAAVLIQNTRPTSPASELAGGRAKYKIQDTKIKDSKKLSPRTREKFYKILTTHPVIEWGFGRVSEKIIDKINILEATKLAMKKAVKNLNCKLKIANCRKVDFLILDGNFKIDLPISQRSIIKADEKVFSCAAASIIAKVMRDRLMRSFAKKYPHYGFEKHKGYATKLHLTKLKKHGSCEIHRKSFRPIKTCKLK